MSDKSIRQLVRIESTQPCGTATGEVLYELGPDSEGFYEEFSVLEPGTVLEVVSTPDCADRADDAGAKEAGT